MTLIEVFEHSGRDFDRLIARRVHLPGTEEFLDVCIIKLDMHGCMIYDEAEEKWKKWTPYPDDLFADDWELVKLLDFRHKTTKSLLQVAFEVQGIKMPDAFADHPAGDKADKSEGAFVPPLCRETEAAMKRFIAKLAKDKRAREDIGQGFVFGV